LPLLGDPWLAGFLAPCMYANEQLRIEAPISARLAESAERIQSLLTNWFPTILARVPLRFAEIRQNALERQGVPRVGCFHSCGVDSWYSCLKHGSDVTLLILIRGFDIRNENDALWEQTRGRLEAAAQYLKAEAVPVETNLREIADVRRCSWTRNYRGDFWGKCLHGSNLAAVALCLQSLLRRTIIPSSFTRAQLFPWGSHPELDPLWATEDMEFVHDGCEASRLEKIRSISECDVALSQLRVCYHNVPGRYNCCVCEKCCRTMIGLRLCGVLEKAASFHRPLDLDVVRRTRLSIHSRKFFEELLEEAATARDEELMEALRVALGEQFSLCRTWGLTSEFLDRCLKKMRKEARSAAGLAGRRPGSNPGKVPRGPDS